MGIACIRYFKNHNINQPPILPKYITAHNKIGDQLSDNRSQAQKIEIVENPEMKHIRRNSNMTRTFQFSSPGIYRRNTYKAEDFNSPNINRKKKSDLSYSTPYRNSRDDEESYYDSRRAFTYQNNYESEAHDRRAASSGRLSRQRKYRTDEKRRPRVYNNVDDSY
jgi:hypothetical protein